MLKLVPVQRIYAAVNVRKHKTGSASSGSAETLRRRTAAPGISTGLRLKASSSRKRTAVSMLPRRTADNIFKSEKSIAKDTFSENVQGEPAAVIRYTLYGKAEDGYAASFTRRCTLTDLTDKSAV